MSVEATSGETPVIAPTLMETATATETPPAPAEPPAEKSAEEAKPPEGEKPAEFSFDAIKLPEGMTLPDDAKASFTEIVTKNGISTEAAQAMMDLYAKQVGGIAAAQAEVWKTTNETWQAEVKADKDIGGDKYAATLQTIAKVMADPKLAPPGLKEAFNLTGAGNNPAVVKFVYNLAKIATESGRHVSGTAAPTVKPPENLGDALYGSAGPLNTTMGR